MGLFGLGKKAGIPSSSDALPGRSQAMPVPEKHHVNGNPLKPPFPENMEQAVFGLGCSLGCRKKILATGWCIYYCGRLCSGSYSPILLTKKYAVA